MTVTWHRDPRAVWRCSGGRFVLSPEGQDEVLLLEGTAAVTWELLAEPMEESDLVRVLAERFVVEVREVAEVVEPFMEDLLQQGAVYRT